MEDFGFREFVDEDTPSYRYNQLEVANLYFQGHLTVREIARKTNCSIGEIYRTVRNWGEPNRHRKDQITAINLVDSGLPLRTVADITGYTLRHIRNIVKKNG